MPLIDETYFIGELNIPNTDQALISEPLLQMVAHREKELLMDLLGYTMYKDLIANPNAVKWTDLKNGKEYTVDGKEYKWEGLLQSSVKRSLIANYVYYWWIRNQVSKTAGAGEVKPKAENSTPVSPADKMVKAWNDMSDQISSMYHFLYYNADVYGDWEFHGNWYYPNNGWYGWHWRGWTRHWKYEYINNFL